jgi:hypothetical protein
MLTAMRKTTYAVELDGTARELRNFKQAIEAAGQGIKVQIAQNDPRAAVAFFPVDSPLVDQLPEIGSAWEMRARR